MAMKLANIKMVEKQVKEEAQRIEADLLYLLEYLVEELINHAKESAEYEDQTSNLKGSIGGVVLKDGKPITYRGFIQEGKGDKGPKEGLSFINYLSGIFNQGYVILVVAGMEYATYVEDIHQLNVLSKTELLMNKELPLMLAKLKDKLK